jgi:hypothetical protein
MVPLSFKKSDANNSTAIFTNSWNHYWPGNVTVERYIPAKEYGEH